MGFGGVAQHGVTPADAQMALHSPGEFHRRQIDDLQLSPQGGRRRGGRRAAIDQAVQQAVAEPVGVADTAKGAEGGAARGQGIGVAGQGAVQHLGGHGIGGAQFGEILLRPFGGLGVGPIQPGVDAGMGPGGGRQNLDHARATLDPAQLESRFQARI